MQICKTTLIKDLYSKNGYILKQASHIPYIMKETLHTILKGAKEVKVRRSDETSLLIVGNGPSMDTEYMRLFSEKMPVLCVNMFALSEWFGQVRPKYYCLADPLFFDAQSEDSVQELLRALNTVDWNMTMILPQGRTLSLSNRHIKYEFLPAGTCDNHIFTRVVNQLYKKNLLKCGCQTVIVGALHYVIVKKFRTIYLAGVDIDHFTNYHVNSENHVMLSAKHFYKEEVIDCTNKGMVKKGEFYKCLGYYSRMLEEFYCLSKFAKFQGTRIINLSPDSFVDVFRKEKSFQKNMIFW